MPVPCGQLGGSVIICNAHNRGGPWRGHIIQPGGDPLRGAGEATSGSKRGAPKRGCGTPHLGGRWNQRLPYKPHEDLPTNRESQHVSGAPSPA
jgi:hypothetical protein